MRIIKLIIITGLLWILIVFPVIKYTHVKITWEWWCMLNYINYYYPEWAVYEINLFWNKFRHTDYRWLENRSRFATKISNVHWCYMPEETLINQIFNSPYCMVTLVFENLNNNKIFY